MLKRWGVVGIMFALVIMIALTFGLFTPVSAAGRFTWEPISSGVSASLYDLEFTGSFYITVGYGGCILGSNDGATWIPKNSGVTVELRSVAWNGRLFVAVGAQGTILTSPDGTVWTKQQSTATEDLVKVIWDGSSFIVSAKGPAGLPGSVPYGAVLKSTNGVNWSYAKTVGTRAFLADLLWNGKQYVGVGLTTGTPVPIVYTSMDAVNWTIVLQPNYSPIVGALQTIAWNGSCYAAGGMYGVYAASTDLTKWTVGQNKSVLTGFKDIAFDSVGFVAPDANGQIWTSADGINWGPDTSPSRVPLNAIKNIGQGFMIVGNNGTILVSRPIGNVTPTPTSSVTPTSTPTPTPTRRIRVTPTQQVTPTMRVNTPTPTIRSGGYVVNFIVSSDWGTGANITVTIKNNTSVAINGWTLVVTFSGPVQIGGIWGATYTIEGNTVTFKSAGYNDIIPANGGAVNFGFTMTYSGTMPRPIIMTLNGTPCMVQ